MDTNTFPEPQDVPAATAAPSRPSVPRPARTPRARWVVEGPEDLVAFVPLALGFVPEHSAVMLTFDEAGASFHARVDMPASPDDFTDVVSLLLAPARRHGVVTVALVLYSDEDAEAFALEFCQRFIEAGIGVLDALRVSGRRWFEVLPQSPEGAPGVVAAAQRDGHLFDLSAHRFTAHGVLEGRVTHRSREDLAHSIDAAEATAGQFRTGAALDAESVEEIVWQALRASEPFTDAELTGMVASLPTAHLRDRAWSWWHRADAERAVRLWSDAARRVPDDCAADVCAVLGFAAWLAGDGALAWCALDRAARSVRDHPLSSLVADLLDSASPPTLWDELRGHLGSGWPR